MQSKDLVGYVESRAGAALRTVAEYDPDGYELTYVRDDASREAVHDQVGALHRRIAGENRDRADRVAEAVGDPYASVQLRERAVIVNLITGNRSGVLVELEPEVCRDLNAFVTECLSRVRDEVPPAGARA